MRPGAKIFFFGLLVFLFSFLTSLADQPNFEGDAKRIRGREKELLRERRFGPNPYFRSEWFRSTEETYPEEFQKGLVPYAEPFDLERHRPGRHGGIPFQHSSNAPLTIAEQRLMHSIIDDFLVNDDTIGGYNCQYYPAIARAPSGNFVIAWADQRSGYGYWDIYAQRYDASGTPLGSNFRVNDAVTGFEPSPAIAMDGCGNFIITWDDGRNGNWDIYAQRYDSAGTPSGENFKVSDDAGTGDQWYPQIAMGWSGNFVIVWDDERNGNWDIYAQRYDSAGTPSGKNFKVSEDAGLVPQLNPAIAIDGAADFVITWQDGRNDTLPFWYPDIYAQRYDSSGNPLGVNFKVNDDTGLATHWYAKIAADNSGDFVIAWLDYRNDPYTGDIYAQRYNSSGVPLGSNFVVNNDSIRAYYYSVPAIASNGAGNFVISWERESVPFGVYAQRYDSLGSPLGANFKVDDTLGRSSCLPAVALDDYGNFVITWADYRNDDTRSLNPDIYSQMYDSAGNPLGANFRVGDDIGVGNQYTPSIAVEESGNFVITWEDRRDCEAIYAQRYDSRGNAVGNNLQVAGCTGSKYPKLALDGLGNLVITWEEPRVQYWDIYARRYDSSGTALGASFKVNNDTGSFSHQLPAVATFRSGNFVITWTDNRNDLGDIYAQRYDSSGAPLGSNFKVNDGIGGTSELNPVIASDAAGNLVMAWTDRRSGTHIYAQRYDSSGTPLGSNFKVSDSGGFCPAIALDASGNFIIAWYNGGYDGNIYAQRYDFAGTPLGSNFKVNYTSGTAVLWNPSVAVDNSGKFVITWQDNRNSNNYNPNIYGQRYDASGNPIGGNYLVNNPQSVSFAQFYPAVAANNSNIYFAWQDNRRAKGWDIYAKVVDWNWTKVGEEQNTGLPKSFELAQNYPNPFNPTTTIQFRVGSLEFGRPLHTTLKIYNILGQLVKTLVDEEKLLGNYNITWDGKDDLAKDVASGIYFYQLKTKDYTDTKKMILLR